MDTAAVNMNTVIHTGCDKKERWSAKVDTLNDVLGNEMRQVVSRWNDLRAMCHSPFIVPFFSD